MLITTAIEKMIDFYEGNIHDIDHFLKVWALAKTIGEAEGLDGETQGILEMAAIIHDIACPLCREKYGNTNGKHQEEESAPLVDGFLSELSVGTLNVERVKWLVEHHHTYTNVDGMDYQILLEADFLVNAGEGGYSKEVIENACKNVFRTATGTHLLKNMYLENV
ncbi:MAG: HD domain-containing protein [Muricoprocola sp.]